MVWRATAMGWRPSSTGKLPSWLSFVFTCSYLEADFGISDPEGLTLGRYLSFIITNSAVKEKGIRGSSSLLSLALEVH
jgi:hypothetical protein